MGEHSIIPPSSASIWVKCTGWVQMAQQYPENEEHKAAAAEGEASHEVAELLIRNAAGIRNRPALAVGDLASNGQTVTDEMFQGAELYANDVIDVMRSTRIFGGVNIGIEERIHSPRIHELSFGTADSFIFHREGKALYLWDYKFGYLAVEAFENWQSLDYVCGLLDRFGIDGIEDQDLDIVVRIVQPRAIHRQGPIREWRVKASDLRGYFNILQGQAAEALGLNATLQSGSHCRYCQARHACPAALEAGVGLFEVVTAPVPIDLSIEALGLQLSLIQRAAEQIKALETGYSEQVKALVKAGKDVPGWALEPSLGRETWAKPLPEVFALGDLMGVELRKEAAITPNQARKLGIDKAVITAYSETPKRGLTLVPDTGQKVRQAFKGV